MNEPPTPPPEGGVGVKPRYQILTACDALQPQPPQQWVVERLIPAGSVSMFFGEGGSKKTWCMVCLAVCVALGRPFLNFTTRQGPVLLIDEESGPRRMLSRLGDVLRGQGAGVDTPVHCVSLAAFNLGVPNDIGELYNLITTTHASLVIIDALADVMPGRDENSVKDVQPVFLSLRKIAEETRAAIVVIHHANKGGSYRGSTAIKGSLDLLVSVESKTGANEIAFRTEKARDTLPVHFGANAAFMPGSFSLSASASAAGTASSRASLLNQGERYVLRYLLKNGVSSVRDISDNADSCSAATARNATYDLAAKELVVRTNGGGQGVKAEYDLTEKGKKAARAL